jgi:tRNA(adenine34) deaminase
VSAFRGLDVPGLNHRFAVTGGVLEDECRGIIQQFFREKRQAESVEPKIT